MAKYSVHVSEAGKAGRVTVEAESAERARELATADVGTSLAGDRGDVSEVQVRPAPPPPAPDTAVPSLAGDEDES
jgi:hypothetical protein